MSRVYSWEISKDSYAYIVNPNSFDNIYIGNELYGDDLNKVINWVSNCTEEEYKNHFLMIKNSCTDVTFASVEEYLNVTNNCDDLKGPAGRGIEYIVVGEPDEITRKSTCVIYYDDGNTGEFVIQNGFDGKDGINGEPGTNGYDGISSKFVMVYSSAKEIDGEIIPPNQPTGGTYNFITNEIDFNEGENNLDVQGWRRSDSDINGIIYMSSRTFTSTEASTDKEWSVPVRISGEQGLPGKDGNSIEFIYNLTKQEPDVSYLESKNENGYVPPVDGWTGSPTGVDENNTKEWCSIRTYDNDNKMWGNWQKATIWSNYGVNGQDGDGVQYIYYRTLNGTPPENPTPNGYFDNEDYQNVENEWFPPQNNSYENVDNKIVSFDDIWEDNPKGVDFNYQYEWVASRKYRKNNNSDKKSWTSFSNPSLWAKFGVDGKNATSIRKIYTLTSNTDTVPPLDKDDITGGSIWGTGFPTGYKVGENVVWGAEAEIWAHNHEFVKSYKLVNNENGNPPSDATEENTKEVNSLPTEEIENFKYVKFENNYYIWEGGYCEPFIVTGLKGDNGNSANYTTYVFAYGYKDYIPSSPNGETPENPGTSLDSNGNTVEWMDFPDTSDGKIDNVKDEDGNIRRWYQCCGYVYGYNNTIKEWGQVYALNGMDGTNGIYTEFRFKITTDTEKPDLIQYDTDNNIIREPEGWVTLLEEFDLPDGGAMWQIWATIDSATDKIKGEWSGPVRISGEKGNDGGPGPAGARGIPGVSQNQMYCLGTAESPFGKFTDKNKTATSEEQHNIYWWLYSNEIPNTNFLKISISNNNNDINQYAIEENLGRVLEITITENNRISYAIVILDNNTYKVNFLQKDIDYIGSLDYLYIWSIQGRDIYGENPEMDENGEYIPEGVSWCSPFKLQGMNGLPGKDGTKGQITYPMGIYNANEVYITTDKKAPYVIDSNDGLYYVLNKQMSWVGQLPRFYKIIHTPPTDANNKNSKVGETITVDSEEYKIQTPISSAVTSTITGDVKYYKVIYNDENENLITEVYWGLNSNKNVELKSKYKYSTDGSGTEGTWLVTQGSSNTPSVDYVNNSANGTNCWERFESFDALYASVAIIENGTVGSAVFNGNYMFSQQGITSEGAYSESYEKFNSKEPYNENNEFRPNICIDFKKGEMWASQGNIKFSEGDIILNGYIKKQKTILTPSNINYYTITINNNTRALSNSGDIPSVGGNSSLIIPDEKKYLDFNKIGSFVEFKDFTENDKIQICLHSLPGFVTYGVDNTLYIDYDEVRCLIDNHIYMVNSSRGEIQLYTLCREAGNEANPEKKYIPIAKSNFINLYCISASINNYERIFWEYSVGLVNNIILPTDDFDIGKCVDGVPANPCS